MDIESAVAALLEAHAGDQDVRSLLEDINRDEENLNGWAYDNFRDTYFLGAHERDIYYGDRETLSDYHDLFELRQLDETGIVRFFNERLNNLEYEYTAFHYLEVKDAILTIDSDSHGQAGEWFSCLSIYRTVNEFKTDLRKRGFILIDDGEAKLSVEEILELHFRYIIDPAMQDE